jgi:serpin B
MTIRKSWLGIVLVIALLCGGILPALAQDPPPELAAGNNAFAFDLYRAVRGEGDNLIVSPYSISAALAMTYAGARGDTAQQMADTLHFTLPQEELHPAFSALDASLTGRGNQEGQFQLNIANALWGQEGYGFLDEFLDLVNQYYGAGLNLLDFLGDPEGSRETINAWVEDKTEDRIQDLLKPGTITSDTQLVLTNAIYFKASWLFQFEPGDTQDAPFTLLDGTEVTVPMMDHTDYHGYLAGDGFQAVDQWYVGGDTRMIVILPDEGRFAEIEDSLSASMFEDLRSGLQVQQIRLLVPRFEYEADFSLAQTLKDLGMPIAFDDGADFSGMTGQRGLFISDVIHKAFVKVDETGTEAAAATAVIMAETAAMPDPEEPLEVRLDRPFIYLITDQTTGSILFVGRVLNPAS